MVILYPGKFKPFTSGHYDLIKRCLKTNKDAILHIIISNKEIDGITPELSKNFIQKVLHEIPSIGKRCIVDISEHRSPIRQAYQYIRDYVKYGEYDKDASKCTFTLLSSSKGGDTERTERFLKDFSKSGKYYSDRINVVPIPIKTTPTLYRQDRSDKYRGKPISASVARMDANEKNQKAFITNFSSILEDAPQLITEVKKLYGEMKKSVRLNESAQHHQHHSILNEGGAAGHISHIMDVNSFTFDDYFKIINDLYDNKLDLVEKVDGINMHVSYIDDEFVFARNKSDLKGSYMELDELWDAFNNKQIGLMVEQVCMRLIQSMRNSFSEQQLENFFTPKIGNSFTRWINMEIVNKSSSITIPYMRNYIIMHEMREYSEDGSLTHQDETNLDAFVKVLSKKLAEDTKQKYTLIRPKHIDIDNNKQVAQNKSKYINKLKNIFRDMGMETELDYSAPLSEIKGILLQDYIYTKYPDFYAHITNSSNQDLLENLVYARWIESYKQKDSHLRELSKYIHPDHRDTMRELDSEIGRVIWKLIEPIHDVFVSIGDDLIASGRGFINSEYTNDPLFRKKTDYLNRRIEMNKRYAEQNQNDQNTMSYFDKLNNGFQNHSEGVVFEYGGRVLKLTGSYYYLNKVYHLDPEISDLSRSKPKQENGV